MTAEYNEIANSIPMWLASVPGILVVLFQSVNIFRKSKQDATRIGLTDKQVNSAIRSAAITSIAPCFVILTAMLSLMLYIGAPLAWLRVDFIGSVSYNLQGVDYVAQGMGIELGSAAMNVDYLASTAIVLSLGSLGWVIFTALFADKMEKVNLFMARGNEKLVPIIGTGALIGVFSSVSVDRLIPFKNQGIALIASGLLMFLLLQYNKKANRQIIREWGLTAAMIFGVVIATITSKIGLFS